MEFAGHVSDGAVFWTVEEASCWLTPDGAPLPLKLLQSLGRDCSMVCRLHKRPWLDVPVFGRKWLTERGYTADTLRQVFAVHPDTREAFKAMEPGA